MKLNPYSRLLNEIKKWCYEIRYPKEIELWYYGKEGIKANGDIFILNERVIAAQQLGYEVYIVSDGEFLRYKYRRKMPEIPRHWRY